MISIDDSSTRYLAPGTTDIQPGCPQMFDLGHHCGQLDAYRAADFTAPVLAPIRPSGA